MIDTNDIKVAAGGLATGMSWAIANELITFIVGVAVFIYTVQRIYLNAKHGGKKTY